MEPDSEIFCQTGQTLFRRAAQNYFDQNWSTGIAKDDELIDLFAGQLSFAFKDRFFIAIPVYAGDLLLGNYLESLLPAFKKKPFNICVFLNATTGICSVQEFENAYRYNSRVIAQFNERWGFNTATLLAAHLSGTVSMGRVRKILVDTVII